MAKPPSMSSPDLLDYGSHQPVSLRPSGRPAQPARYLAFDADLGGFNNILMNFEIMVALASLTGRVLILPPPRPFYLLGDSHRSLLEFFDRRRLERQVEVLTADEFVARRGLDPEQSHHDEFHRYMSSHGHNPGWNSSNDAVVDPPNALTTRLELIPRLLRRRPVAIIDQAEECEILYFPSTDKVRLLGPFETFLLFGDSKRERLARTLVRDAVRYHPKILAAAVKALQSRVLSSGFGAMHIRRGDFQYEETRVEAASVAEHTRNLFEPGQTLYVSTDEQDPTFLDPLREHYSVATLRTLVDRAGIEVPYHYEGIVESLICAAASGNFVGTRLSTFSARIATLRGYLSTTVGGPYADIDTALYYTQPPLQPTNTDQARPYNKPTERHRDALGETAQTWWTSAATVPLWGRAYSSVWMRCEPEAKL